MGFLSCRISGSVFLLFLSCAFAAPLTAEETESVSTMPSVEVTAKRRRGNTRSGEFGGETIEVDDRRGANLRQILSSIPSVLPRRLGNDLTEPTFLVRGLDPIQNRTLVEGIPLTDAQFNQGTASPIALENISRVEFYPEGAPANLLEDGGGGATNLRLVDPQFAKRFGVSLRGGSLGFARGYAHLALPRPWAGRLGVEYARSDENFRFFDDNGTPLNTADDKFTDRKNNGFRRFTVFPQIRLLGDAEQGLQLFGFGYSNQTEIPGPVQIPTRGTLDQKGLLMALQGSTALAPQTQGEGHLYFRRHAESLESLFPTENLVPNSAKSDSLGGKISVRTRWRDISASLSTGLTYDLFRSEIKAVGSGARENSRVSVPVGASLSVPLGSRVVVRPAILGHWYAYSTEPATNLIPGSLNSRSKRDFFLVSPRLGAFARVFERVQLRASGGSFYRAPTMHEIYGAPMGVTPSQDLGPERAWKGDIGFDSDFVLGEGVFSELKVSYTYFLSRSQDLIAQTQNSQLTRVAINIGESAIQGHEAAIEVKARPDLSLRLSGTWMRSENLSDVSFLRGKELPGRPEFRLAGVVGYAGKRWGLEYQLNWEGRSYWDLANTKLLSSWMEQGVAGYWDASSFGTFYLEVRNLFDAITAASKSGTYETIDNNTGAWGYPSPGRRMYLTWKYEL